MRARGLSSLVVAAMLAQDGAPARYARSRKGKKHRPPMTRTRNRERERRSRQIEAALAALEQMWKDYMSDRHPNLEQINDAMKGLRAALASTREEA